MQERKNRFTEETLCREIVKMYLDTGTIDQVATALEVSDVKVRKVLITEGLWSSPTSTKVGYYLDQGKTSKEIAGILHTTVKAVQQYMPYSRGVYRGDHPSADAQYSAEYRERIRVAKEKVVKKNREMYIQEGWEPMEQIKNTGIVNSNGEHENSMACNTDIFEFYPGQVCLRQLPEGLVDWQQARCRGIDVVRLHLELRRDSYYSLDVDDDGHQREESKHRDYDEETRVLKTYGQVRYGETISRDILVPSDIPLYALHYAIQRLFGWQNSHLHRYELPPKQFFSLTGNRGKNWLQLIGVLLQSPLMNEDDHFWADDYEYGSFKTWLKKKYTGPYCSLCHGEGLIQCAKDVKKIKKEYPLFEVSYVEEDGRLEPFDIRRAPEGSVPGKVPITESNSKDIWHREVALRKIVKLEDCDTMALVRFFVETGANHLLERLTIDDVLALHGKHPEDDLAEENEIFDTFEGFMDEDTRDEIKEILREKIDLPYIQPMINPPTDVLYYYYDYGDGWKIRITGSYDACDLVKQGRIKQEELDEAIAKVYMTYRPVCIAADGLPLVDDVGGVGGFTMFLRSQNPRQENAYWGTNNVPDNGPYDDKQGSLVWAKSLGWTENMNMKRML